MEAHVALLNGLISAMLSHMEGLALPAAAVVYKT